jgi:hypothetical protein
MKKKVYFVINAPNFGGHENMFLNILNIIKYEYQITILLNAQNEILISKLNIIDNVNILTYKSKMNGSFHFNIFYLLLDVINHSILLNKTLAKYSTIIFFDGGVFASLSLQLITIFKPISRVLCIPLLPNVKLYNNTFTFYIIKKYLKSFQRIITVNNSFVKFYKNTFKINDVICIPNFIPDQKFNFRPSGVKPNNKNINLLFLGRISFTQKALDNFVENISIYQPDNFIFTIIGDGPDKFKLIELVKFYNISSRFHFKGWKMLNEIQFSDYDLMFQCSHFEGDSLSILESINNGLNVISTNVGTFCEYFPANQIFSLDSATSFTDAVYFAIENSGSRQFWEELGKLQYSTRNLSNIKRLWIEVCETKYI